VTIYADWNNDFANDTTIPGEYYNADPAYIERA
jgi:hypothetical protein